MVAAAYFRMIAGAAGTVYVLYLIASECLPEIGRASWSAVLTGVAVRLLYAGIFAGICVSGVRRLRALRQP